MEKEIYYKLESNDGKGYVIVQDLNTIRDMISMDVGDIDPNDVEQVYYTITPVLMTEEEYRNLPENEDW